MNNVDNTCYVLSTKKINIYIYRLYIYILRSITELFTAVVAIYCCV